MTDPLFYFVRANRVHGGATYEVEGGIWANSPKQAAQKFCWSWGPFWKPEEIAVFYHGDVWCFDNTEGFLKEIED